MSPGFAAPSEHRHPEGPHPTRGDLEAFMRGTASRPEARSIVRHLLTGCPSCRRVTSQIWRLGDAAIMP
jgi:hypothetical protein